MDSLTEILWTQWQEIRRLTNDYLSMLTPADLDGRLPFAESQPLCYQFRCMVGAQESYLRKLEYGEWRGFSSSLDQFDPITPSAIRRQMGAADAKMRSVLEIVDLQAQLSNGQYGYEVVMQIIKHEMHHHGQLINYLYALQLDIPDSWQDEWALSRNG